MDTLENLVKMKLPLFIMMVATNCASTPDGSGLNLNGKMFTLSRYAGLHLFSPYMPPPWLSTTPHTKTHPYTTTRPYTTKTHPYTTTRPYTTKTHPYTTTRPYTTTTRPYTPWTTAPTTRGVSVCLRYISDFDKFSSFTLSPSSNSLRLYSNGEGFTLTFYGYNNIYLYPRIRLWSDSRQNMWTSICVTVDTVKKVAQMFRNSDMSPRKLLPTQYTWSGEPVIDFSDFEGQVTDVQVWDYPLRYKEVLYYTSAGFYGPYQGSVLNWSYISFSIRGNTLLEETFEQQMKLPAGSGKPRRRLRRDKSKEARRQLS
uniref:Pentraxin (PTX) domain-containing protein n=1 Tax=Nothobranchius pienaari TaxID=704102 RepID=A0A1A8LR93_9TELE